VVGDLLFASFLRIPDISDKEVGFTGRAIGKGDRRESITVDICNAGWEMRLDLNTFDRFLARISAFSLSVDASELSGLMIR